MSATTATNIGRVGGEIATAYAWLSSPAHVDAEIRRYTAAVAAGDTTPATAQLLNDWHIIREAQARLVGASPQQGALDLGVR